MNSILNNAIYLDNLTKEASDKLDQKQRSELGQYLTRWKLALFIASFFPEPEKKVHLLDAGAGIGSLSLAFLNTFKGCSSIEIEAYEIDKFLTSHLEQVLINFISNQCNSSLSYKATIYNDDFVRKGTKAVFQGLRPYTHAILNPPYKKIKTDSVYKRMLQFVGHDSTNLYSAFVSLSLAQLKSEGHLVAIIPRSFCNGPYFKPFRKYIVNNSAISRIHLFKSRTIAFKEDSILQENVIIHLIRDVKPEVVLITESKGLELNDLKHRYYNFEEIVKPHDADFFIHIPNEICDTIDKNFSCFNKDIKELGISISTGPIVDFRFKDQLSTNIKDGFAPILYPANFNGKELDWPVDNAKPKTIQVNLETKKNLWPSGYYTLVRRLTSKEEKQRVVARVFNPEKITESLVGFENHLNVFHIQKSGLDPNVAYGLAAYLNSSYVNRFFSTFNGNTQVNVADLKKIYYPSLDVLFNLGVETRYLNDYSSLLIDELLKNYIE